MATSYEPHLPAGRNSSKNPSTIQAVLEGDEFVENAVVVPPAKWFSILP
jgi:hypothetical protein